jgi:hypothetical protein
MTLSFPWTGLSRQDSWEDGLTFAQVAHALRVGRSRLSQLRDDPLFPAPDLDDSARKPRWSEHLIADFAFATDRKLAADFHLPGWQPLGNAARWVRASQHRLQVATFGGEVKVPVHVTVYEPAAGPAHQLHRGFTEPRLRTPQVLVFITPLWPSGGPQQLRQWAAADVVTQLDELDPAVGDALNFAERRGTGELAVTVVVNVAADTRIYMSMRDWEAGPLAADLSVRHVRDPGGRRDVSSLLRHRSTEQLARALGHPLPFWPLGTNLPEIVPMHRPGKDPVPVTVPGNLRTEMEIARFCQHWAITHNDAAVAAVARTCWQQISSRWPTEETDVEPPPGWERAAVIQLPEPDPQLPDGDDLFTGVIDLLGDTRIPRRASDAVYRYFGDVGFGPVTTVDLAAVDAADPAVAAELRRAVQRAGRLHESEKHAHRVQRLLDTLEPGSEVQALRYPKPNEGLWALVHLSDAGQLSWIAPATRAHPQDEHELIPQSPAKVMLFSTSRGVLGGWITSVDGDAWPLPLRDDGHLQSDALWSLITGCSKPGREERPASLRLDSQLARFIGSLQDGGPVAVLDWETFRAWVTD